MTSCAEQFITALTLETLTNKKVVRDMFSLPIERAPAHISLAEEADIILVAPASANMIAKCAAGISDDALSCTIAAADCPVIFAPAMNDKMFTNVILQEKIEYLKTKGYHFVDPVEGHLACGRTGMGHLAPIEQIVEKAEGFLAA